jgi:serine/threonine-protein kinase
LSTPVDIAVGADGSVYLSHSGRVDKLVGTTQTTLGFTGLTSAYGIAVDATNAVYVVDHTGHTVYRRLGSVQSVVGFTGLAGPVGVAVDSVGGVYVSDATNNAAYRLSGGVQTTLPFSTLVAPQFLAVTAA